MPFNSNLPPGLYRRLQYANYIKHYIRNNNRRSNINFHDAHNVRDYIFRDPDHVIRDLPPLISDDDHIESNDELFFKTVYNNTKIKINNDDNIFCPICQSNVKINTEIIRELKCKHTFHLECIDRWFISKSECPLCKKKLED